MRKTLEQKRRAAKARAERLRKQSEEKSKTIVSPAPIETEVIKDETEKAANPNAQENKEQRDEQTRPKRKAKHMILVLATICLGILFVIALGFALKDGSLTRVFWSWIAASIFAVLGVAFLIQAYVIEPREVAKAEATKEVPQKPSPPPLRGLLIPGNDPPPIPEIPPDKLAVIVGDVLVLSSKPSASILTIGGEEMISFEKTSNGMYLNAIVRNENDEVVARIIKNVIRVEAQSGYYAERPDQSTLVVIAPSDQKALYVRYMNQTTMKVLGIFKHKGRKPIVIEEGRHIPNFPLSNLLIDMGAADTLVKIE